MESAGNILNALGNNIRETAKNEAQKEKNLDANENGIIGTNFDWKQSLDEKEDLDFYTYFISPDHKRTYPHYNHFDDME